MKLKDLEDRVRFMYNDYVYEFRRDRQDYDGSIWIIGKVTNVAHLYGLVHLITPSGFSFTENGITWSFSRMRKLGFEYRVYSLIGEYIASRTVMDDAGFAKMMKGAILGNYVAVRVTSNCPTSQFPKELDTSIFRLKKQQL